MEPMKSAQEAQQQIWLDWVAQRARELSDPEGWLSLVGLHWLDEGPNVLGSDPSLNIRLPVGPEFLGVIHLQDDELIWQPLEPHKSNTTPSAWTLEIGGEPLGDARVRIFSDRAAQPSLLRIEQLCLYVIERDGRYALRVKDRAWSSVRPFQGLSYFPFAPNWQIQAKWETLTTPFPLQIPTMSGDLKTVQVKHRALFELNGRAYSLLPMEEGNEECFFVFRDASSGKSTYGGGRFLRSAAAREGSLILDFNRAYNPPCAFTAFAACPLPPPENRLELMVEAGEKRYTDH